MLRPKYNGLWVMGYGLWVVLLSGCVVRTYQVTKDRVDQDLSSGNRGYLKGEPSGEIKERKLSREVRVVEVELHPPIKFEKMPKEKYIEKAPLERMEEDKAIWGNRGYISESALLEASMPSAPEMNMEQYSVEKGDTLQKISKKFYGTTKKWNKIYQANQDRLKAPDKIYPGQVINIPVEPLKETKENLK